jgi:3-mercaptopyruvate sulfurtransferase SseA
MARKLYITSALAAALLLGACKAADTAGGSATSKAAAGSAAAAAQAGGSGGGTTTVSADGARRVTPAELQKMVEGGAVAIYDTRSKGAYDAEHIKGALSMPTEQVAERAAEFPKDKTLVFYCT